MWLANRTVLLTVSMKSLGMKLFSCEHLHIIHGHTQTRWSCSEDKNDLGYNIKLFQISTYMYVLK